MRELDVDALGLLTGDVDLLHARHMQQPLAQRLGVAHQHALRFSLGLEREQGEGDVRVLVIDHRPDHASRQIARLIAELLARLIELFLHQCRGRAVEQRQGRECQAGPRVGLCAVVVAQLLQALLELLGDLVLHLLRRGAGPGRDDGHHLDGKGGIFRAAQLEECDQPRQRDQADQEQRDGSLAYGQCRQVEAAFAHGWAPPTAGVAADVATRTFSPSRSR
ncbi:hypothetical protein D3C87_1429530 [compost metagenome]